MSRQEPNKYRRWPIPLPPTHSSSLSITLSPLLTILILPDHSSSLDLSKSRATKAANGARVAELYENVPVCSLCTPEVDFQSVIIHFCPYEKPRKATILACFNATDQQILQYYCLFKVLKRDINLNVRRTTASLGVARQLRRSLVSK